MSPCPTTLLPFSGWFVGKRTACAGGMHDILGMVVADNDDSRLHHRHRQDLGQAGTVGMTV